MKYVNTLNRIGAQVVLCVILAGSAACTATANSQVQEDDSLQVVTELLLEIGTNIGAPVFTGTGILVLQDDGSNRSLVEYQLNQDIELILTGREIDPPELPSGTIDGFGKIQISEDWMIAGSDSGELMFYRRVDDWFELENIWTPPSGGGLSFVADMTNEWLAVCRDNPQQTVLFRNEKNGWTEHSSINQSFWYASFSGDELLLSRSDGPGHAKIFKFDGTNWGFSDELPSTGIRYGQDSSLEGNLAAVADRDYGSGQAGAVFVYERDAPGAAWNTVAEFGPQVSPTGNQETAIRVIRNGRVFCAQVGNCKGPSGDRALVFVARKQDGVWSVESVLEPVGTGVQRFGGGITESGGVLMDGSAVVAEFTEEVCTPTLRRGLIGVWSEWRDCNEDGIWDITQILSGSHPDLDLDGVLDCCVTDDCPRTPDVNGDGCVDSKDLAMLLDAWGINSGPTDLNRDDRVDAMDLTYVLAAWERCE